MKRNKRVLDKDDVQMLKDFAIGASMMLIIGAGTILVARFSEAANKKKAEAFKKEARAVLDKDYSLEPLKCVDMLTRSTFIEPYATFIAVDKENKDTILVDAVRSRSDGRWSVKIHEEANLSWGDGGSSSAVNYEQLNSLLNLDGTNSMAPLNLNYDIDP